MLLSVCRLITGQVHAHVLSKRLRESHVAQHGTKVTTLQEQHLHSSSTKCGHQDFCLILGYVEATVTPIVDSLIRNLKLRAHCPKHCLEKKRCDLEYNQYTLLFNANFNTTRDLFNLLFNLQVVQCFRASNTYCWPLCVCVCLWLSQYEHTTDCDMASWSTAFAVPSAAPADLTVLLFDIS